MRCRHQMPFGAQCLDGGGVLFRLWAPSAGRVDLCLHEEAGEDKGGGGEWRLPMNPTARGWYALEVAAAGPGSRYRFRIEGGDGGVQDVGGVQEGAWVTLVPDPASRYNPGDVHGASQVVDPLGFDWQDQDWRGRPWAEAVIYELHLGAFTSEGSFRAAQGRLGYLAELGVTAIELMPVADFPGQRNWGYDGVLPYAPDASYGTPDELKALVQAAHAHGLMVLLDVVYNHFGPEGNYLHGYAPAFFSARHHTPWGAAINFDGARSREVREFFIHNALYWLEEYRCDGLRLDAVHAIQDDSRPDILEELAEAVRTGPGRERLVHLVLENDHNAARYLDRGAGRPGAEGATYPAKYPAKYAAQWNDDLHHACHVLLTGEADGYYADYAHAPARHLARCLAEGYAWQGEPSPYRQGAPRGEPSGHLAPAAFVAFLQNHDQVGNRALGERLAGLAGPERLRAAVAAQLLSPQPPLLFMGEEFGAATPFLFFCDFGADLRDAVREGRRREFARFERFADPAARAAIPDPNDPATFQASKLDWDCLERAPHRDWLAFYRTLLALRRRVLAPRLDGARALGAGVLGPAAVCAAWRLGDGARLTLFVNLGSAPVERVALPLSLPNILPQGEPLYAWPADAPGPASGRLAPACTVCYLEEGG